MKTKTNSKKTLFDSYYYMINVYDRPCLLQSTLNNNVFNFTTIADPKLIFNLFQEYALEIKNKLNEVYKVQTSYLDDAGYPTFIQFDQKYQISTGLRISNANEVILFFYDFNLNDLEIFIADLKNSDKIFNKVSENKIWDDIEIIKNSAKILFDPSQTIKHLNQYAEYPKKK